MEVKQHSGFTVYVEGGEIHRSNGPAVIGNDHNKGFQAWIQCNEFHRLGEPAISYSNGDGEWWEFGKFIRCDRDRRSTMNTYLSYFESILSSAPLFDDDLFVI